MAAHVTIEVNPECLAMIVQELELSEPPDFTLNHSGRHAGLKLPKGTEVRGTFNEAQNLVTITSQGESYEREGLYVLTKHIRFTVLHEMRHAWQREHWTAEQKIAGKRGPYELRPEELDANAWAAYASPKYTTLVQIKRRQVGKSKLPA